MEKEERDQAAYALFKEALPYYYKTYEDYPDSLRFKLMLNRYSSAWSACVDIANHVISSKKLAKQAQKELVHHQTFDRGLEFGHGNE